jgi:hypothetical protein
MRASGFNRKEINQSCASTMSDRITAFYRRFVWPIQSSCKQMALDGMFPRELPEAAWQRKHPRDPSTRAHAGLTLAQEDSREG